MSSTPTMDRDSRMLPGVSAFIWARVALILFIAPFVLIAPFLALLLLRGAGPWMAAIFVPFFLVVLASRIFGFVTTSREKAEARAGYTTLPRSSPNLDQLDPRTGVVVRRAGEPLTGGSVLRGSRVGSPSAPDAPAFPARTARWYLLRAAAWGGPFVVVILIFLFTGEGTRLSINPVIFFVIVLAFTAGIPVVVGLIVAQTLRSRVGRLAAKRPGLLVFTGAISKDLLEGLARVGAVAVPTSGRVLVVASDETLELWTNAADPVLVWSQPWSEVVSLNPGTVSLGNRSLSSVDLGIRRGEVLAQLPIGLYGRAGAFAASPGWANQVYDELAFHVTPAPPKH